MNDPKSSLQAVESLLSAVNAHARDLNDKVLPPDGDSYNELLHLGRIEKTEKIVR
ncbi:MULTISPECIES: hypothetical protein [Pseudomonas]|uniref:hypothetical protein n=1 Tax=Pseudomonas TaxID=286 RepID=UPI001E364B98|nr:MULTISPECIES: hypothetical protein [Pseudomonas]MCE0946079.1 hypothetical protein [Pseudomonas asiatica]MCE1004307.1 hypothetical protein [Pseudomonas sp. NMI1173_11]MCE1066916.1 hypothetical protein [Pseudomonas asiatica]